MDITALLNTHCSAIKQHSCQSKSIKPNQAKNFLNFKYLLDYLDPALLPNPICMFAFSKQGHSQLIWPRCIILTTAGQSQWPAAHHSLPLWVSNGKHTPCGRAHILYMHKYNTEYSIYYPYNQILHGKYGTWEYNNCIIDAYTLNYKLESDL